MPRKSDFFNSDYMSRKELEQYFTTIQERFNDVDKRFDYVDKRFDEQDKRIEQGFNEQNKILQTILDIVRVTDVEIKEIKLALWDHHRRLTKVENQLA